MSGKDILSTIAQGMSGMSANEIQEAIARLTNQLSTIDPSEPIEGVTQQEALVGQVANTHGGFSYEIDNVTRLKRYLILGSSCSEYSSTKVTDVSNTVPVVNDMIRSGQGRIVIDTILELNKDARISREEHFLVVLRDCIMYKDEAWYDKEKGITIQRKAYDSISRICNIPTKLFRLIKLFKEKEPNKSSGWGRARKRGVSSFYTDEIKDADRLLMLVTKYRSYQNWDHKQVVRYCHPKMTGDEANAKNIVMQYATRGYEKVKKYEEDKTLNEVESKVVRHIKVLEEVKKLQPDKPEDVARLLELMEEFVQRRTPTEFAVAYAIGNATPPVNKENKRCAFQLAREHLPNGFLKLKSVSLIASIFFLSSCDKINYFLKSNFINHYLHNQNKYAMYPQLVT